MTTTPTATGAVPKPPARGPSRGPRSGSGESAASNRGTPSPESWTARRPAPPADPDACWLTRAQHLTVGDVLWLWRMASSPLTPGWYRVAHLTPFGDAEDHEETVVVWLEGPNGAMPHLMKPEHSVLGYTPGEPA